MKGNYGSPVGCNPSAWKNYIREGIIEVYGIMSAIRKVDMEEPFTVSAKRRIRHRQLQLFIARLRASTRSLCSG